MKRKSKLEPLSGLRILVGRAHHQASALSSALRKFGAETIEIPFIEIRRPKSYMALDRALQNLKSYEWLILTSVNGVDAVWNRAAMMGLKLTQPKCLKVAAIGPATRDAILKHGFKVNVMPRQYIAEAVAKSLRSRAKDKRVLLARAKVARDVIPEELRKAGAYVDVVEAYETVLPKAEQRRLRAALKSDNRRPHIITFTSSSMAKNFDALLDSESRIKLNRVRLASIGPITSKTLRELGFHVNLEADPYTIPGLVASILNAVTE